MNGLALLERATLESLEDHKKTFQELKKDLSLKDQTLTKIIQTLSFKGLIRINNEDQYYINPQINQQTYEELNHPNIKNHECHEIIHHMVFKKQAIKLKKVRLSTIEEKILRAMFQNIDDFLKDCHKNNKFSETKTLVTWGISDYQHILKEIQ